MGNIGKEAFCYDNYAPIHKMLTGAAFHELAATVNGKWNNIHENQLYLCRIHDVVGKPCLQR